MFVLWEACWHLADLTTLKCASCWSPGCSLQLIPGHNATFHYVINYFISRKTINYSFSKPDDTWLMRLKNTLLSVNVSSCLQVRWKSRRSCRPSERADSCWSQLPRGESDGQRWTCPPLSRFPPGRWGKTFHASSPADAGWSGTQRGSERSERSPRSDLKSWRRRREKKHRSELLSWNIHAASLTLLLFYLQLFPISMSLRTSSVHFTSLSCSPTTCTCCFPSSRTRNLALRFSRSNTLKYNTVTWTDVS